MNISQAVECGIIPSYKHQEIMDTFSRFPCHVCKSFKVVVLPEYGNGAIKFKCERCGADRGNIYIDDY